MKWIGLTGGIATGKSTVAKIIRDLGLPVIDADSLARSVTQIETAGLTKVVSQFGKDILLPTGELNREKLGQIIFSDTVKREELEKILHPLIREAAAQERMRLEQQGCELAFYDVPLLFEKKIESEFDATILIYASEEDQRSRLALRDKLSADDIERRLKAQMPIDEKIKKASYVIFNNSNLSELKKNVLTVLGELAIKNQD